MIKASIILVDDNSRIRKALRRIIQEDPTLQVIHEARDGVELLGLLEGSAPDIVILDTCMPRLGGLETAEIIKQRYPLIKIMVMTMQHEKDYFRAAKEIGVNGYMIKEEAETDLNHAIKTVLQGNTYTSPLII